MIVSSKSSKEKEKTFKTCFINNIEKGTLTAREIFMNVVSKTSLNIIKISLKDEVDNQMKSYPGYGIKPEPGYNLTDSHPFLKDYIFKKKIPIKFEESKNENQEVISEEEKDLPEIHAFIEFFMNSYIYKVIGDTKKLYSLKENLNKIKSVQNKQVNNNLSTFKDKEKVDVELWVSKEEEAEFHNTKLFFKENQNVPVYLNFGNRNNFNEQKLEEITDAMSKNDKKKEIKIIGLNKQFQRIRVLVEDLDFGELVPNSNTFKSFFSLKTLKSAWKELNIPGTEEIAAEFFYSGKEQSKSQKLFIVIPMFYGFELKIEFSYKFCKSILFDRENEEFINLYANLLIPPRIYLQNPNKAQYEASFLRLSWPRVHNFFLLNNHLIDEIHKIYLMNNTVLKLKFKKSNENNLGYFQEKIKSMNIMKKIKGNIKYESFTKESTLLTKEVFEMIKFQNPQMTFNLKYNMLCLLTENKISVYDDEILEIIQKFNELKPEIIESTLEDLCKILHRGFLSNNDESFKEIFVDVYKRKSKSRILEKQMSELNILKTRKISLTPSGILFNLKEPEMSNRVLRKYKDDLDLFLRVKFADDDLDDTKNMKYVIYKYFKPKLENFTILDRRYEFMAFSASQLRGSACWMFATIEDHINAEQIVKELGTFDDKIPAKRAARIGQSFSASFPIVLKDMNPSIKEIEDIKVKNGDSTDKSAEFSDGIGKISKDLMDVITSDRKLLGVSAIQIRFGGAKGVLAKDPYMEEKNTILLRPSMIKFKAKYMDLEILDYNKYRGGYLNRQIILLLITSGVNPQVFRDLQDEYLSSLDNCTLKDANIFQYFNAEYDGKIVDMPPVTILIRKLINAQFTLKNEPFIMGIERTLRLRGLLLLKKKSNILVKDAARILGVLDEYGVLEENEVCVQIQIENDGVKSKAQWIEGSVMVTRNPCLHPGDIRIMNAVRKDQLKHLVNCIVFPQKGDRPVTSMISGGDLDGDLYFVSWDKRLLPERITDALSYVSQKPNHTKEDIKLQDMLDFFIKYMNFDNLGKIANSHLAIADQSEELALDERCLRLAELHSDAVDFVKTGYCIERIESRLLAKEWPDFMEKKDYLIIYESQTILGELYREVKNIIRGKKEKGEISNEKSELEKDYPIDLDLVYGTWEEYINVAFDMYQDFEFEMNGLMNLFNIRNEFEVYSGNFSKFTKDERKGKVNVEILQKRVLDNIVVLKKKFELIFWEKIENDSEKSKSKASAIYLCSYLNSIHQKKEEYSKIFAKVFESKKYKRIEESGRDRIIGLPWMIVGDLLIKIKEKTIKKEKNLLEKTDTNKTHKNSSENDRSDEEREEEEYM